MDNISVEIKTSVREFSRQGKMEGKRIFLFGLNIYTERINNFLYEEGYRISAVLDNDKGKQGKDIIDIPVLAPDSIYWGGQDIVLIASKHEKSMREQICQLSDGMVETASLVDLAQHIEDRGKSEKFWLDENYQFHVEQLCLGEVIYHRVKQKEPLVVFWNSIGDIFLFRIYLPEYKKRNGLEDVKIIVSSDAAYNAARIFGMNNVEKVAENECSALIKYIFFLENKEDIVFVAEWWARPMGVYKNVGYPRYIAKYTFHLDDPYRLDYPSIWKGCLNETELLKKGLIKGKSIILAPYTNSIPELPLQFWEILAERLGRLGYFVFTNTAGKQKPVKGTKKIEIPLEQVGIYLEHAGCFIALRSGLCDIAGHSRCKQIIIFRELMLEQGILRTDLHIEHVSDHAIQYIYCDSDFYKNVECILRFVIDAK